LYKCGLYFVISIIYSHCLVTHIEGLIIGASLQRFGRENVKIRKCENTNRVPDTATATHITNKTLT
jgi:hypothetical protein